MFSSGFYMRCVMCVVEGHVEQIYFIDEFHVAIVLKIYLPLAKKRSVNRGVVSLATIVFNQGNQLHEELFSRFWFWKFTPSEERCLAKQNCWYRFLQVNSELYM